jgi:hypothetical protein
MALVRGLCSFGSIENISLKTKKLILKELLEWKNQLYVIEAVGKMASIGKEKYGLSDLYIEMTTEILDMLKRENDVYSEKEKTVILGCFASIINNNRIDPSSTKYKRFVDSGLKFLVRGFKEGVKQTLEWIEAIGENSDIPKSIREEAKDVLKSLRQTALQTLG